MPVAFSPGHSPGVQDDPIHGKGALDLACGFGFYTRLLKQHGAAQVIGVDISPEMIRLAREHEQREPLGITYQVGDAAALQHLGRFDLVAAVHLLNYATSQDHMLGMCRSAYNNLVEGGRFIAYTVIPEYTLSKPNGAKYGSYFLRQTPEENRYVCDAEFVTEPPTPYQCFQWSQEAHERAVKEAEFQAFAWHPSEVSPEDIAHCGEEYWRDWVAHADREALATMVGQAALDALGGDGGGAAGRGVYRDRTDHCLLRAVRCDS